jgi:hypothetical protein
LSFTVYISQLLQIVGACPCPLLVIVIYAAPLLLSLLTLP